MDYHKVDEPLRVREYGRNVQIMTERMLAETDSRRQAQMAHEIIRVMNTIAPAQKDLVDQKRKLWDNLFRISDYQLNPSVMPFRPPVPLKSVPPTHIPYQNKVSKYKPYGRNVELLVEKALTMPDSPERDRFILQIAQIMRTFLHNYSSGVTSDKVIFEHLANLSGGKIVLSPEEISLRNAARQNAPTPHNLHNPDRQNQHRDREHHHSGHQIHRKKASEQNTTNSPQTNRENPTQEGHFQRRPYQQNQNQNPNAPRFPSNNPHQRNQGNQGQGGNQQNQGNQNNPNEYLREKKRNFK